MPELVLLSNQDHPLGRLIYTDTSGQEVSVPFGPDHPMVTIGRATDCTIQCNRKSVSRRHAQFTYSHSGYEVIDLNSSNGTYLIINENRQPVKPRASLTHNDEIWCGDFILYFYDEVLELADADSDPTQHSVDIPDFTRSPQQNPYGQPQQNTYGQPQPHGHQQPFAEASPYTPSPNQTPYGANNSAFSGQPTPPPQNVPQLDPFGAQPIDVQPYDPSQMDPFGQQPNPYQPQQPNQLNVEPYNPLEVEPYQADPYQPNPYQPIEVEPYQPEQYHANPSDPFGAEPYTPSSVVDELIVEPYNPIDDDPYPQVVAEPYNPISSPDEALNTNIDGDISVHLNELAEVGNWNPNDTSKDLFIQPDPLAGLIQQDNLHAPAESNAEQLSVEKQMLEDVVAQQGKELADLKKQLRIKTKELETARHTQPVSTTNAAGHEQALAELESAREEQRILEQKLHAALQNAAKGQEFYESLQDLQQKHTAIDIQLQEALTRNEALTHQLQNSGELSQQVETLRQDLQQRDTDNASLRQQLVDAQQTLHENKSALEQANTSGAHADSLKRELDRNKRLLDEFERRNRTMQQELDDAEEELKTLRVQLEDLTEDASTYQTLASSREGKVEELTSQKTMLAEELAKLRSAYDTTVSETTKTSQTLESLQASNETLAQELQDIRAQRDTLQTQLEEAQAAIEESAPTIKALHQEVEGLKQRVRMEKDRAKSAIREKESLAQALAEASEDAQSLQESVAAAEAAATLQAEQDAKIQAQEETILALEAQLADITRQLTEAQNQPVEAAQPEGSTIDPQWLQSLMAHTSKLSRIIEAIERTDISGLGPVDRVRLRSALRDTTPGETLTAINALLEEPS